MRKTLGLLCAAALMLPIGIIAAQPAGSAAATPTCTKAAGTFKFTPPLPASGGVKSTLSSSGTISGCSGGGVTSGKTVFKSNPPTTTSNCSTLAHPSAAGTKGTFTVTWNNGKTSTVSKTFTIKQDPKTLVNATTVGKITSGMFVGKTISGAVTFKLSAPACPTKGGTYTNKKGVNFTVK